MDRVASGAGRGLLALAMGIMALHAIGKIAMFVVVADCAVYLAVGAGVSLEFFTLVRMTCIADSGVFFPKDNMQGLMGILVTT